MRCSALALMFIFQAGMVQAEEPGHLGIDPERITVSGMSSGAQMAHQLHLAYSDIFSGAALLAGGPYGCADGSISNALGRCLGKPGTEIPLQELMQSITNAAENGQIAPLTHLQDDPVWIFHGSLDNAVPLAVNNALVELYGMLLPKDHITVVTDIPAAHTFPADGQGSACDKIETPFVGDCGYDAAGILLQALYPGLTLPSGQTATSLTEVNLQGADDVLLDESAWLFVPPSCSNANAECALHLVLHGCGQSASQVNQGFMEQSGYLRWAEANNIVLAFPQVVASMANPLACWDWWGYSDENYLWRNGKQMRVLADWVRSLAHLPQPAP